MDKYLNKALANVCIENEIDASAIEIIKQAIIYAKEHNTSILTSLYELSRKEQNERKDYNKR